MPDQPALVVATPGAEPPADGGYAGAVLLDTGLLLLRPEFRAAEEALRRWLNVVALVRPGGDGGSVIAVGESSSRALQALVRTDPGGFAARELTERTQAGFPPSVRVVVVEGAPETLEEFVALARLPADAEILGPVEVSGSSAPESRSIGWCCEPREGRGRRSPGPPRRSPRSAAPARAKAHCGSE